MKKFRMMGLLILTAVLMATCGPAVADRGGMVMRPVTMTENIDVYDAGQKAIICWHDGVELMILSTDKYTSHQAKVLEFLPLPSKPDRVEEADIEAFEGIARLIRSRRPKVPVDRDRSYPRGRSRNGETSAAPEDAVEIVFHEKIGAHDITIGHVLQMDGFREWVKQFVERHQMEYREEDVKRLEPIVKSYLDRGFRYFVFDVVELSPEKQTIEPILYQFKSPTVYFPLKVTTLSRGETNIALYLFTRFKTDIWGTKSGLASGFYRLFNKISYQHPIKFTVSSDEVKRVSGEIHKFMYPQDEKNHREVWFSTAVFEGPTSELTRDFIITPGK